MASASSQLSIKSKPYGKHPSGQQVTLWTLSNNAEGGIQVQAIDYGAILVSVLVPDASGVRKDVVLGYDRLDHWVNGKPWFNSLVGRNANRIAQGRFTLDGQTIQLEQNNLGNNLHSGAQGWNSRLMHSRDASGHDEQGTYVAVEMTFASPDGEGGFPGALEVATSFRLYGDNTLHMDFRARHADAAEKHPTVVSMCNHAYWNLNGSDGRQTVLDHLLRVNADAITELDGKETMLATGRIIPVADTPYDFRRAHTIGGPMLEALDKTIPAPGGYDINYVLNKEEAHDGERAEELARTVTVQPVPGTSGAEARSLRATFAARLHDPSSGRVMDVHTSAPGVQVYSGNFLDGSTLVGRQGVAYPKHAAVCLETQSFPGFVNHLSTWGGRFPSPVLRPGEQYAHVVQHRFSLLK